MTNSRTGPAGVRSVTLAAAAATLVSHYGDSPVPAYDGLWSVSIVTEKGDCDRGYRYPIRISNGSLANAGDTAFIITGKVAPTGAIIVTVSAARQERHRLRPARRRRGRRHVDRRRLFGILDGGTPRVVTAKSRLVP